MTSPWVFPSKTSKSGHLEDLKRAWTTIRKQTKLTDVTIHDLRRSLASAMASQNVNVALIQSALHHKDLKTTLGVYLKQAIKPCWKLNNLSINYGLMRRRKKGRRLCR